MTLLVRNRSFVEDWKQLKIGDHFRIRIPADAQARFQDEGETVAIRIGKGDEASEILIANVALSKTSKDPGDFQNVLRETIAQFFDGAVRNAAGRPLQFSVEAAEDVENKMWFAQGASKKEENWTWLAKACARLGEDQFWLLHWNGPDSERFQAMKILSSFRING